MKMTSRLVLFVAALASGGCDTSPKAEKASSGMVSNASESGSEDRQTVGADRVSRGGGGDLTSGFEQSDAGANRQQRLNGAQIKASIAGYEIMPDPGLSQVHIGFSEYFYLNGAWKTVRSERGVMVKTGTWRIDGDRLCVRPKAKQEVCREVWIDRASGNVALRDAGSGISDVLIMIRSSLK